MFRFQNSLSRNYKFITISRRLLARGRSVRSVNNVELNEGDSILDSENSSNYLGINEQEDKNFISGDRIYNKEYKELYEKQIKDKYGDLLDKKKGNEVKKAFAAGKIRYDSENIPKEHGQFENEEVKKPVELSDIVKKIQTIKISLPENVSEYIKKDTNIEDIQNKEDVEKIDENSMKNVGWKRSLATDGIQFKYLDEDNLKRTQELKNKEFRDFDDNDW